MWSPARQRDTEVILVKFDTATCRACPLCWEQYGSGRVLVRDAQDFARISPSLAQRMLDLAAVSRTRSPAR